MLLRWLTYLAVLTYTPDYVLLQRIYRNRRSDDTVPCDYGWFYLNKKCYRVGGAERNLNWDGAVEHCTSLGANLVTIESKEENDFLVALLLLRIKQSAWIGLNDKGNESDYLWQSGSTSEYRNWRENEPSGESREKEDCVQLLVDLSPHDSVGEWNDNDCDHYNGYICEKKENTNLRSPNLRSCSSDEGGGFKFLKSCYHIVSIQKTWEEAEKHCIQNFNGHLITVLDKTVDYYLKYLMQSFQRDIWIGIKIRDQFQQKWTSGWYVGYNGFSKKHQDYIEGTCVVRNKRKEWGIVSCSRKFSFICETSREKVPVLKKAVKGSYCPSVPQYWRDMDGELCYFIETENVVSWYEANFECMARGGNLISIHSKEESDILHPFIRYTGASAFIGLFRQYGKENAFGWTDGSAMDYLNWNPSEPNNENEKCGEARASDMQWNDILCSDKRAYICTMKKITPNITSFITATTEKPPECDFSGTVSIKVLIGVAVCVVLVVVLLGVVIYNFLPGLADRKKNSSAVNLQPCAAPRQKYRSAEIKGNEQDYYETMDS